MTIKEENQRLAVSLPFLLVTVLVPLLIGRSWILLFAAAALLHEAGHLAALRLLGGRVERICLRLSGGEIRYRGRLSYGGDALVALAGPLANLLCALLCAAAARRWPEPWLYRFIGCHVTLALFNLLPALPLDGGRILQAALEYRFPLWGEIVTKAVGLVFGVILSAVGLVILQKRGNPTLLAAGWVILLRSEAKM